MKKREKIKKIKLIILNVFSGIFILFFTSFALVSVFIIKNIEKECVDAQDRYQLSCVDSLLLELSDSNTSFTNKNDAIWALGQLGDKKALVTLKLFYTEKIPEREAYNEVLSQYELKKAINLLESGDNVTHFFRKGEKNNGLGL